MFIHSLFQAIRKALFKPGAFFKGFLIPLCEEGNCTLKEAIIIGSVLAKNSIAILHSCAAMIRIAELEYTGANSIFLRYGFRMVGIQTAEICSSLVSTSGALK